VLSTDIRGAARLAVEATLAVTDRVEAMHRNIAGVPWLFGAPPQGRARGISGLVYRNIRRVTRWVGSGLDLTIEQLLQPAIESIAANQSWQGREAIVAALNGVCGDHLAATGNPLAISMQLRIQGVPVHQLPGRRMLLMIHGLCMNDLQWRRGRHDHGIALARDLGLQPAYLHYNTGLHISLNGRELAERLETWVADAARPVTELYIVGHSMGGLVARSACHHAEIAGHRWLRKLRKLAFLGTPHLGAPLERGGHWLQSMLGLSPYTAPLADLGKLRSAGITDLRHGSLIDEDWLGLDRFHRAAHLPQPVPLPRGVHCVTLAATAGKQAGKPLGDGLVPVASALGQHSDPARCLSFTQAQQWLGSGIHHLDLLGRQEVYDQLLQMLNKGVHVQRAMNNR
jgi:pimeloyl-ACP methyl ester carboxylesterase